MNIGSKVAVVTGGAGGIGFSIASALARAGAAVALADIDGVAVEAAASRLREQGAEVTPFLLDVGEPGDWARCVDEIKSRYGNAHILCNNAGLASAAPVADLPMAQWDRIMRVNASGAFYGSQIFIAHLRDHGEPGHIVNTASIVGLFSSPGLGAYVASKYAIVGLSEMMRFELEAEGTGVSVLCPGVVGTSLAENSGRILDERRHNGQLQSVSDVVGSAMEPEYIGSAVVAAIEANTFYVITHPEYRSVLEARHRVILEDFGDSAQPGYVENVELLGARWLHASN
jgi:NAD(P)-dependent dehydrogenase (short-subunit alcohol dehydrogenase family)